MVASKAIQFTEVSSLCSQANGPKLLAFNDRGKSERESSSLEPSYKRPESVLILVATLAGEVLMMERSRPHGFWQSVTGSLHWGESAREAAIRELSEETGLKGGGRLVDLQAGARFRIVPPWRARYAPAERFNHEHWFLLELTSRRTVRLNPKEHRQYRWMQADYAARRATSWTNRKIIREWKSRRCTGQTPAPGHRPFPVR
jgi:dATP pyrophosphohydrolase